MNYLHTEQANVRQRMAELRQAADNHRLAQQSRAHQPRLHRPLLAQLGRHLSQVGQHLQETYNQK